MKTPARRCAPIVVLFVLTACSATADLSSSYVPADAGDGDVQDVGGDTRDDAADAGDTGRDIEPDPGQDADGDTDTADTTDTTDSADIADSDTDVGPDVHDDASEGPATWAQFCAGEETGACDGQLAQVTFRFGLCTCRDLLPQSALMVDAFDSDDGPFVPGGPGGSFGTNGHFDSPAHVEVTGSSHVGGASGMRSAASISVGQNLYSAGPVSATAGLSVGGDAYVNGDVVSSSAVRVSGTLHTPVGAVVEGSHADAVHIADWSMGPVDVGLPCDCGDDSLDIPGHVARFAETNDNVAAGVTSNQLRDLAGSESVELPCGRLYFDSIDVEGSLTLHITGRTSVYVNGDVTTADGLAIVLGRDAEVDFFVAGKLQISGGFVMGEPSSPARARLYVAGADSFVQGGLELAGNLAAPNATLEFPTGTVLRGAVAAKDILLEGDLTVHHDLAVLRAGERCGDPVEEERACASCRECGNQACIAGVCGACTSDSDCCAPLGCAEGRCQLR